MSRSKARHRDQCHARQSAMMRLCAVAPFVIATALFAVGAQAQPICPEGKSAAGDCVDADLAAAARRSAIIFSQPKISETAYPVLPVDDWKYRYPGNLLNVPSSPAPTNAVSGRR
jgi:hypothetical protein